MLLLENVIITLLLLFILIVNVSIIVGITVKIYYHFCNYCPL